VTPLPRNNAALSTKHTESKWESPSASLIEQDPEVIPDVDIAAQVGKDLFLDEKIPRRESGQGYVRVVEKSIMWRETETVKVFTYQGLTTCTELSCQGSSVAGQPQCPRLWHSSTPNALSLSHSPAFCSPSFFHTISLPPSFTSA